MAKKNEDFFKEKKQWSEVKDELLGCYIKPYLQKILMTRKPIVYVDCFAGKGMFEDGKEGSPVIALSIMKDCLAHTHVQNNGIYPYFIELRYADELKNNLSKYKVSNGNVIKGKYEKEVPKLLSNKEGCNVFLYIDPYGIKALNLNMFDEFVRSNKFYSIELLINLNSFGFIRAGCRVLGVKFDDEALLEDLIEYETTKLAQNEKSVNTLNNVAGGDYWQEIIQKKNRREIDTKEAEQIFTEEYCKRLSKSYKYVLNMPLKIKKGHAPKYRMVHATNHAAGCLLMVDNICGRWQLMKDIQMDGQQTLFKEDIENNLVDENELSRLIEEHIKKYSQFENLNDIIADFFVDNGVLCNTTRVKDTYKSLEKADKIEVERNPARTTLNKESKFWSESGKQKVKVRWK